MARAYSIRDTGVVGSSRRYEIIDRPGMRPVAFASTPEGANDKLRAVQQRDAAGGIDRGPTSGPEWDGTRKSV